MRKASCIPRELIPGAVSGLDPGITPCCKSPKLPGDNFPAVRRSEQRTPIRVASITLPRSPVSLSSGDEVPHIFTRKSRLRPGEFLITCAKRLLQQNLPGADSCTATKTAPSRAMRVVAVDRHQEEKYGRATDHRHPIQPGATARFHHCTCRHRHCLSTSGGQRIARRIRRTSFPIEFGSKEFGCGRAVNPETFTSRNELY